MIQQDPTTSTTASLWPRSMTVHLEGMDKAFPGDPELLERGLLKQQETLSPGEPLVLSTEDL
jgi:hypothetical protein